MQFERRTEASAPGAPPPTRLYLSALPDHRLAFTRKSRARGCGVSDVVADEGSHVWGVVYELTDSDLARLDDSEGYREDRKVNAYVRRSGTVLPAGDEEKPMQVWIYFAVRQKNTPLPNAEYKGLISEGSQVLGVTRRIHKNA